jgi:CRP/FNR family cyclic AMP-dependent transcriptional regulator
MSHPRPALVDTPTPRVRGVRLLAAEPELMEGLTQAAGQQATQALVVPIVDLGPGEERVLDAEPERAGGLMGLLVLEGLLLREVEVPGASYAELVGAGDLILPGGAEAGSGAGSIGWRVLQPSRVAILDRRFVARVEEWPQVLAQLTLRALRRNHELAWQSAIRNQTRVDHRVLQLLWHYAGRWGRVTPDGVHLELPLTHVYMAKLVGAHRPSVTSAIGVLERRGLLLRPSHGTWLLTRTSAVDTAPLLRSA